jgi:hypothetical protein
MLKKRKLGILWKNIPKHLEDGECITVKEKSIFNGIIKKEVNIYAG